MSDDKPKDSKASYAELERLFMEFLSDPDTSDEAFRRELDLLLEDGDAPAQDEVPVWSPQPHLIKDIRDV